MHPNEEIIAKYLPGLPEEETRFPMPVLPATAPPAAIPGDLRLVPMCLRMMSDISWDFMGFHGISWDFMGFP